MSDVVESMSPQEVSAMLSVHAPLRTMPAAMRAVGVQNPHPCLREWDMRQAGNDEWLATVAHELRSPLATILYALDVITSGPDRDPGTRRACDIAERQVRFAIRLVDDIFDVCAGG